MTHKISTVVPWVPLDRTAVLPTGAWSQYINDLVDVNLGFTTGPLVTVKGEIAYSTEVDITASTTQSQGQQPLTKTYNEISTCANPNDTVTMPGLVAGKYVTIVNNGAQDLQVFPASGDNFQGSATDASITLGVGKTMTAWGEDDSVWQYNLGASPADPNTSIQYNSGGQFAGSANLTFDDANNHLTLTGSSGNIPTLQLSSTDPATAGGFIEFNSNSRVDSKIDCSSNVSSGQSIMDFYVKDAFQPLTRVLRLEKAAITISTDVQLSTNSIGYSSTGGLSFDASNNATFTDDLTLTDASKMYFRDTNTYIYSQSGGYLNLNSSSRIVIASTTQINVTTPNIYFSGAGNFGGWLTSESHYITDNNAILSIKDSSGVTSGAIARLFFYDQNNTEMGRLAYDTSSDANLDLWNNIGTISIYAIGNVDIAPVGDINLNSDVDLDTNSIGYDGSAGGLSFDASNDATFSDNLTLGSGAAGVDYTLTFNGENANFVMTWNEGSAMMGLTGVDNLTIPDGAEIGCVSDPSLIQLRNNNIDIGSNNIGNHSTATGRGVSFDTNGKATFTDTVEADTYNIYGTTPIIRFKDTNSTGSGVISQIQFQDSTSSVVAQMGYTSGSDTVFDLWNNIGTISIYATGNVDIAPVGDINLSADVDLALNSLGYDGSAGGLSFDASNNATFSNNLTIGDNSATDFTLTFDALSDDCVITWQQANSYLKFQTPFILIEDDGYFGSFSDPLAFRIRANGCCSHGTNYINNGTSSSSQGLYFDANDIGYFTNSLQVEGDYFAIVQTTPRVDIKDSNSVTTGAYFGINWKDQNDTALMQEVYTGGNYSIANGYGNITLSASGNVVLSPTGDVDINADVDLGVNSLGYDGSAGGLSFDASNNATFSGDLTVSGNFSSVNFDNMVCHDDQVVCLNNEVVTS